MGDLSQIYFDVSNEKIDNVIVKNSSAEDFYEMQQKQQAEKHQQEIEDIKQTIEEKRKSAKWIRIFIPTWVGLVLGIVALNNLFFHISDTVLGILLGSTTLGIFKFGDILLKGLFPENKNNKEK